MEPPGNRIGLLALRQQRPVILAHYPLFFNRHGLNLSRSGSSSPWPEALTSVYALRSLSFIPIPMGSEPSALSRRAYFSAD